MKYNSSLKGLFLLQIICSATIFCAAQNVGIGVPSPTEKLHIDSGHLKIGKLAWSSSVQDRFIKFGDANYITIGETNEDDRLEFSAKSFIFKASDLSYSGNVGIGTTGAPVAKLEVIGILKITDGSQGLDRMMVSDATGITHWRISPINTGFMESKTIFPAQAIPSSVNTMVAFEVEDYNDGITFSGSTYTASEIGLYHFDVLVTWSLVSVGAASSYTINILKSGTVQNFHTIKIPAGTTGGYSQQISCDMKLSIGSTVTVEVFQNSGISQNLAVGRGVYFSGHRVY